MELFVTEISLDTANMVKPASFYMFMKCAQMQIVIKEVALSNTPKNVFITKNTRIVHLDSGVNTATKYVAKLSKILVNKLKRLMISMIKL